MQPWVAVKDVGPAKSELNLELVQAFRRAGVPIALPQREVRLVNGAAASHLERAATHAAA